MKKIEIKLGQKVRDVASGFEGIAVSRVVYANGDVQYGVTPLSTDGKFPETTYLSYKRLEVTGDGVFVEPEDTGGFMADAQESPL